MNFDGETIGFKAYLSCFMENQSILSSDVLNIGSPVIICVRSIDS